MPTDRSTSPLPPGVLEALREAGRIAAAARDLGLAEIRGGARIPAGVQVWLPEGTLDRGTARSDGRVHTVSRGETLARIARQYGVKLSDLPDENGLRAESVVRPGQRIQIPATN